MSARDSRFLEPLRAFVAKEFLDGDDRGLDEHTRLLELGIIDSMSMVSLLSFVTEAFGIEVPDELVRPEHFTHLGALCAMLERLGPAGSTAAGGAPAAALVGILESYGIRRTVIDVGDGNVQHVLAAEGPPPPWVLVPGPGNPSNAWGTFLRSLVGEQEAYALNLAGFGLSTTPEPRPTVADHVRWSSEALDRLALRSRAVLVASSLGAVIGARLVRARPDRFRAFVVVGFGRIADPEAWWDALLGAGPDGFLERSFFARPTLSPSLRAYLEETLSAPAFRSFLAPEDLASLPDALDGIPVPTVLVGGEDDRVVPREAVLAAAGRIAGVEVRWLARCGHFPQMERAQELLLVIRRFLESAVRGAS